MLGWVEGLRCRVRCSGQMRVHSSEWVHMSQNVSTCTTWAWECESHKYGREENPPQWQMWRAGTHTGWLNWVAKPTTNQCTNSDAKLNFQQPLLQASGSHDPSEINKYANLILKFTVLLNIIIMINVENCVDFLWKLTLFFRILRWIKCSNVHI